MKNSLDEYDLREMPPRKRLNACIEILKNENDESLRWDAVWLAGEIAETAGPKNPIFDEVADLMGWVLEHDNSSMVKHEACYQISLRKMYQKITELVNSAFYDESELVKHEAIEALGLLGAFNSEELINKSLKSSNQDVRETAKFVLQRQNRTKNIPTLRI